MKIAVNFTFNHTDINLQITALIIPRIPLKIKGFVNRTGGWIEKAHRDDRRALHYLIWFLTYHRFNILLRARSLQYALS